MIRLLDLRSEKSGYCFPVSEKMWGILGRRAVDGGFSASVRAFYSLLLLIWDSDFRKGGFETVSQKDAIRVGFRKELRSWFKRGIVELLISLLSCLIDDHWWLSEQ